MPSFVRVQIFWVVLSMLLPGVCMAIVWMDMADPYAMSNIALPTVLLSWVLSLLTVVFWPSKDTTKQMRYTAFIIGWTSITIFFPLCWDFTWAIFHDWVNGATAADTYKWYFWAYAVADTRFLRSDPLMICVEYWSGILAMIEIYSLYHFLKGHLSAAFKSFILAGSLQFYGCTIFFGTELLVGLENIRPDVFSYIKFFGMNGMWMLVPPFAGYFFMQLLNDEGFSMEQTLAALKGSKAS